MIRKNLGTCSIHNCQTKPDQYHGITNNAKEKDTFNQYNYLEVRKQSCYSHYLNIVESDCNKLPANSIQNTSNIQNNIITNNIKPLSFGNKITLIITG